MATGCHPAQLEFHAPGRRQVVGRYDGGRTISIRHATLNTTSLSLIVDLYHLFR